MLNEDHWYKSRITKDQIHRTLRDTMTYMPGVRIRVANGVKLESLW